MEFNPFGAVIAIFIITMSDANGYLDKALSELYVWSYLYDSENCRCQNL